MTCSIAFFLKPKILHAAMKKVHKILTTIKQSTEKYL